MPTNNDLDYALMADYVYKGKRNQFNVTGIPSGWSKISYTPDDGDTGFSAGVFQNDADPTKIVIAFTGTNEVNDDVADLKLGAGAFSQQLRQAASLYFDVMNNYPDAEITFTGHSL